MKPYALFGQIIAPYAQVIDNLMIRHNVSSEID